MTKASSPSERNSLILNFSDTNSIPSIMKSFTELSMLTRVVNATPSQSTPDNVPTFSEQLYGKSHVEFDRTVTSLQALSFVLTDNYEAIISGQSDKTLSQESFKALRKMTQEVLYDENILDAMITFLVIHDLGKIHSISKLVAELTARSTFDHDLILLTALEECPSSFPSFSRLAPELQNLIRACLQIQWNPGQSMQGEDLEVHWQGIQDTAPETVHFHLLHVLYDIAGSTGNGTALLNEETWTAFAQLQESLEVLQATNSVHEARSHYLRLRGALLGLETNTPDARACVVLICMTRCFDAPLGQRLQAVFTSLPDPCRAILSRALNSDGIHRFGILLYYAPATLIACIERSLSNGDTYEIGLRRGLHVLARLYQQVYCSYRDCPFSGTVNVNLHAVAEQAAISPEDLQYMEFRFTAVGSDIDVILIPKKRITTNTFPTVPSLSELPGNRIALFGIGGGSDGLQAFVLGRLFELAGKEVLFNCSVRTKRTGSQSDSTPPGSARSLIDHGGEPFSGVFRINSATQGTGRFLEYLCAEESDMYQLTYSPGDSLHKQMQFLIDQVGSIDTIYLIDTGGDALCCASHGVVNASQTTPDQDLYVLKQAQHLENVDIQTGILACGVDAPDDRNPKDAYTTLQDAKASFYGFSEENKACIIHYYKQFQAKHLAHTASPFLGKTPLALMAALHGQQGYQCLDIARSYVLDMKNPWQPYVFIDGSTSPATPAAMAGCFFMELNNHIDSIEPC